MQALSRGRQADNRRLYRLHCSAVILWTNIGLFIAQTCGRDVYQPATRGVDATSHGGPGVRETDGTMYQRLVARGIRLRPRRAIGRGWVEVTERMYRHSSTRPVARAAGGSVLACREGGSG